MLVACRLDGLSALVAYYAGVNAHVQCSTALRDPARATATSSCALRQPSATHEEGAKTATQKDLEGNQRQRCKSGSAATARGGAATVYLRGSTPGATPALPPPLLGRRRQCDLNSVVSNARLSAHHGHVQSPHFAQEPSHSAANAFNLLEYCG